ncbi:DNA replication licensing factor MCM7 [Fimicolochytrium jonesii]|uniref:DNA replication licensing factor MCM7 n=1 Tax=Fimicolochytrium jonesii TaxID=1396493 RepID=UPI0022FE02AE|nr:DNA replication licensing factor MCM7 [Fimicolochytrium jonesii]KAI8816816.1 MCM2/3/5 family-domain-containing protein [Fimicolochytrium jonesii]
MAQTSSYFINVNYQQEKEKITSFIEKFAVELESPESDADDDVFQTRRNAKVARTSFPYAEQLKALADKTQSKLEIALDDVAAFEESEELVRNIEQNTKRYVNLFYECVDALLPESTNQSTEESDPLDVILNQRRQHDAAREGTNASGFSPELTRRYTLYFKARSSTKGMSVREVKGMSVGQLVKVRGIVTRVSDVKPQAVVMALSCDKCGNEIFQEVTSHSFMPLTECPSEDCKKNQSKGKLYLQTRASKLVKFQEIKLQELTDQVPMGHIPRSMSVHLYSEMTRTVNPGDVVYISGIFLPIPYTGFRALRAGLITDTYLEAHHIHQVKEQYSEMRMTPEIEARLMDLQNEQGLYTRLAQSIAPEIWGVDDVKKALLLLLIGGSTKETRDGMRIRGDLNVCLMGDPGVAKSQLLKQISKIAPRGVYTTGRGSSGVGLTASVMKDPITEEMVLEGGALVLADNGIACIDEFDKMDENDRTAIHEVMEQQTISISKAGITTTLNARASILAAANPQFGRYNPKKRVAENINLPTALLSRFDILWLMLDKPSMDTDLRLARHVAHVHMHMQHPRLEGDIEPVDAMLMRFYVARARSYDPEVPPDVADYIVNAYVNQRARYKETQEFQYTSARTLLSIVRMTTALARLRFASEVIIDDVDEALRLVEVSKASLNNADEMEERDPISVIFDLIKDISRDGEGRIRPEIRMERVINRIIGKGFTRDELDQCLETYSDLWMITANGTILRWSNTEADV